MSRSSACRRTRRGFTLLETVLALALAVLVMGMAGMGFSSYYQLVGDGHRKAVEAQLARAILRQIADDLRGTIQYTPVDASSITSLLTTLDVDEFDASGLLGEEEETPEEEAEPPETPEQEEENAAVENIAQGYVPPKTPGLYGNETELQLDVSHLPRADQYETMLIDAAMGMTADLPSDVKTVAYYVGELQSAETPIGMMSSIKDRENKAQVGLIRRSLDRAVTQWSAEQGNTADLERAAQLLSPEAVAIRFRYFDGEEWATSWNSDSRGGLPKAVEVVITLATPVDPSIAARIKATSSGDETPVVETEYMQTVQIPGAAAPPLEIPAAEESTEGGASATSDGANNDGGNNDEGAGENNNDGGNAPPGGNNIPGGGIPGGGNLPGGVNPPGGGPPTGNFSPPGAGGGPPRGGGRR